MAKGSRGGKRVAGVGGTISANGATGGGSGGAANNASAGGGGGSADSVATVQAPQSTSADFNNFMSMSDDDKADVITKMTQQGVPAHLSDTDFQRFIYNIGLNDKPQVVDDKTLDSMSGQEIFRTVNSVYDSRNDIGYSATEIGKQLTTGRVTRTSDNGGSVYGRGIYFATDRSSSTAYGNHTTDIKKTAVIRAKLNSNANIITYNKARQGAIDEFNRGTKLGKALDKLDMKSAASVYALAKGYNVISNQAGYMCILNRQATTMSSDFKTIR